MLAFSLVSVVLSFVRSIITASLYGATARSDVYFGAMTVVQSPASLFSDSLSALVLPKYHAARDKRVFVTSYTCVTALIVGTACLILALGRRQLIDLCFAAFSVEQRRSIEVLVLWGLPLLFCTPIIFIWDNALRGERVFIYGNLGRLLNAVIAVVAIPLLLRFGVLGLLITASAGIVMNFVLVGLAIVRAGLLGTVIDWRGSLRVVFSSLPIQAGSVFAIGIVFLDRHWAAAMDPGTVTLINMASALVTVPRSLLFTSMVSVYYPFLSEAVVKHDTMALEGLLTSLRRVIFGLAGLASLTMAAVAPFAFTLVYQHGSFDAASIHRLSQIFGLVTYELFMAAMGTVMSYVYYSHGETRLPVINSFLTRTLGYAALVWMLRAELDGLVFGVAYCLSSVVNLNLDNWLIRRRFGIVLMRGPEVFLSATLMVLLLVAPFGLGWKLLLPSAIAWLILVSRGRYGLGLQDIFRRTSAV